MSSRKSYTTAQKLAYYKAKASRRPVNRRYTRQVAPAVYSKVSGRGKYFWEKGSKRGSASRTLGNVGREIGSTFGLGSTGQLIGSGAGALFRLLTGRGEYKVQENTLYPNSITKAIPKFAEGQSIRVRHKEYIGNISSSTSFTNRVYNVNPGNQQLFPWLSKIAENYEQYKLLGCLVYYRSLSADSLSSTNTALGKIVMACDYNVNDSDFINTEQFYSSLHSNSGPPSNDLILAVECSRKNAPTNSLFIRTGEIQVANDERLSDHCKIQVATDGSQAAADIGELWITYDVILFNPVMNNRVGLNVHSAKSQLTLPITKTVPFGTSSSFTHNDIDGMTLSNTIITFPPEMSAGTYMVNYIVKGDSTGLVTPTFTSTNCTVSEVFVNDAAGIYNNTGTTSTIFSNILILTITDRNASFALSSDDGTFPANITAGDLIVTQMNYEDSQQK